MYEVKIIADSISPKNIRITTFELTYPRMVHSEVMTHRVFSRNASSSRAIPIEKMIRDVEMNPVFPIRWGKNGSGMQDHGVMNLDEEGAATIEWVKARDSAVKHVRNMLALDAVPHKQIVNRILEPWMWITVLVTATDFDNWFHLRCHKDAQPEIKHLADMMKKVYDQAIPNRVMFDEWHTPYLTEADLSPISMEAFDGKDKLTEYELYKLTTQIGIKCSVARCARVSYKTHDGLHPSVMKDLALYDRLVGSKPLHASPAEHQATPDLVSKGKFLRPELHGNFHGWVQYRKTLPGECYKNPDLHEYNQFYNPGR